MNPLNLFQNYFFRYQFFTIHDWNFSPINVCHGWYNKRIQAFILDDSCWQCFVPRSLVLSTALDLVDLSEPCERRWSWDRWSPRGSRKNGFSKSSLRKKKTEETELIQVETEPSSPSRSNPERASLDSGILLINERYFANVVQIHHN